MHRTTRPRVLFKGEQMVMYGKRLARGYRTLWGRICRRKKDVMTPPPIAKLAPAALPLSASLPQVDELCSRKLHGSTYRFRNSKSFPVSSSTSAMVCIMFSCGRSDNRRAQATTPSTAQARGLPFGSPSQGFMLCVQTSTHHWGGRVWQSAREVNLRKWSQERLPKHVASPGQAAELKKCTWSLRGRSRELYLPGPSCSFLHVAPLGLTETT